jgi:cobalt-precorrin-5B (C1)-methyltransferase
MSEAPPRGTRTGFTTGACAAAAAKAAARLLMRGPPLHDIEITLPNRARAVFSLQRCECGRGVACCSIIKDAGDDPDCTHGAELVAEVRLTDSAEIRIEGGAGVGVVTKPGLGLEVGGPAVNPVPRRNITDMVREEIGDARGAVVRISVPRGEEMAKETLNARLGILGGISILGTTGIVKPYSTASYKASVIQAIDVARSRGHEDLIFTTGGKSEHFAMQLFPRLPEETFVQVGDFIGVSVRYAAKRGVPRVHVAGMMGKLSKMADGKMQTHAAGSEVNLELLARLAAEAGAPDSLQAEIRAANTARHVLELCAARGFTGITSVICRRVAENCAKHAGGSLEVRAYLLGFDGALIGQHPSLVERAA